MKYKEIILALIIIPMLIFGQNIEPSKSIFRLSAPYLAPPATYGYFPEQEQTRMHLGWHWGDHPRVSYEISSNMSMGGTDIQNYHPWGTSPYSVIPKR